MSITMDRASVGGVFQMSFMKDDSCSSSSSSIGKNSDSEEMEDKRDADEVQSEFNNNAFDSLQALEELLPMRRGISTFYSGKSKSFASLSCLNTTSSVKEIAKPENAYSRKRRNLMASASHVWDCRSYQLHRSSAGGIHKRSSMHTSRSTLALGVAMSRSSSSSSNGSSDYSNCSRSGSQTHLPPLHPN